MGRLLVLCLFLISCGEPSETKVVPPTPVQPPAVVVESRHQLEIGRRFACFHGAGDKLVCWWGPGGTPEVVEGVEHVAGVSTGDDFPCAWTREGEVFCSRYRVDGLSDVVELASSWAGGTTCARRRSGTVACWQGQDHRTLHDVEGITGALQIAVAGGSMCALDATGVSCSRLSGPPIRIADSEGTVSLDGGGMFAAIRANKPPLAWTGDLKPMTLPPLDADVRQIISGQSSVCVRGHTVRCHGQTFPAEQFHEVPNLTDASEIATGIDRSCARTGNKLVCWGRIDVLGTGVPGTIREPVEVANLDDATRVAAGPYESMCALRKTGRVVCWGQRPDLPNDPVPVDIGTDTALFAPATTWTGGTGGPDVTDWECTRPPGHVSCTRTFHDRTRGKQKYPEYAFGNLDDARDFLIGGQGDTSCIVDHAGDVSCFPVHEPASKAKKLEGVHDVIQLVAFEDSDDDCALERAGTVKCWTDHDLTPHPWPNLDDAVELVTSQTQSCIRHRTGKVSCWGKRTVLGDNIDVHQTVPLVVPNASF